MQYVKGIDNYHNARRCAMTLGKFDGLHQGHEMLISQVIQYQKQNDVDSVVLAFDMRPLYEKLSKKPDFLMTNMDKAKYLQDRVDYFIDCPFDDRISSIRAEDFIKNILVERFHIKYLVVGTDFSFGYQKAGDYKMLQTYAPLYDYEVNVIQKKQYQGRDISSTYIKEELQKGNATLAEYLLGHKYQKSFDTR